MTVQTACSAKKQMANSSELHMAEAADWADADNGWLPSVAVLLRVQVATNGYRCLLERKGASETEFDLCRK